MYALLMKKDYKIDMTTILREFRLPTHIGESDFLRFLNTQDGVFEYKSQDMIITTLKNEEAFKAWASKLWTKNKENFWKVLDWMDQMEIDYVVKKYNEEDTVGQEMHVFPTAADLTHFLYYN